VQTRLAVNRDKASVGFVCVFDELLSNEWVDRAYSYALQKAKPWGVYVQTSEALDATLCPNELWEAGEHEKAIGLVTKRALILERGASLIGTDKSRIHGTVVWCLSSGVSNSVEYHIDYAELYRYETSVIHPPLYAGTMHLSPFSGTQDMIGGEFMCNTRGLAHYKQFGYKGRLAGQEALLQDVASSSDWQSIRYKRNRAILHDGDLPHLSMPVKNISSTSTTATARRVILGFNCFTEQVGECCVRAPEHSAAFNRTIKLYQAMAAAKRQDAEAKSGGESVFEKASSSAAAAADGEGEKNKKKGGRMTAKDVLKNPALAKLLVLAARKVKEQQRSVEEEEASSSSSSSS